MTKRAAPPELIDGGLVLLRRHSVEDAAGLARAVTESLDHLRPWMPWAQDDAGTAESQRERIANDTEWDAGKAYNYVMLAPDEQAVVGACGLMRRVGEGGIEIGYWTHVDHGGRGYATAAARALTETALRLPDVQRVEIHCDEANVRSQAIPRKLGYRLDRVEDVKAEAPAETGRSMVWLLEH